MERYLDYYVILFLSNFHWVFPFDACSHKYDAHLNKWYVTLSKIIKCLFVLEKLGKILWF